MYALLDEGLAAQNDGRLKDAVTAFDEALARQPMLDRRSEAAPAYVAYGESLEDSDRGAALAHLRKALRLDEAGPSSSHVRSDIATLEGEDLVAHGVADTAPFETALALDPANTRARTDLERLRTQLQTSTAETWRLVAAVVVLGLALAGIALVGGGRRRSPATTPEGQ